jgi:hypothetical protein
MQLQDRKRNTEDQEQDSDVSSAANVEPIHMNLVHTFLQTSVSGFEDFAVLGSCG